MKLIKQDLINCAQLCVNTYGGYWGDIQLPYGNPEKYSIGHTQFDVYLNESVLYIAFQGSTERADWEDNFNFLKSSLKGDKEKIAPYGNNESKIRVHKGFMGQYSTIRASIHNIIKVKNPKTVILTGHSLGAALATLCAVDIQYNFSDKQVSCVAIASPRVGNSAFAKSYNKRVPDTYRFIYQNDLVTRVPPFIFGFKHVNKTIHLGNFFLRILNVAGLIFGFPWDHYPMLYLNKIKEMKE